MSGPSSGMPVSLSLCLLDNSQRGDVFQQENGPFGGGKTEKATKTDSEVTGTRTAHHNNNMNSNNTTTTIEGNKTTNMVFNFVIQSSDSNPSQSAI